MFVSESIYDPSLPTILLLPSTAFSHRNFPRTAKSSFLPGTLRSVVGTACQFSLSLLLSLFIYWRFLLKARIESVKGEKKKKGGGDEKEQKDYGCLKLICVRFERAVDAVSIETTVNVVLIPKLFLNFFGS